MQTDLWAKVALVAGLLAGLLAGPAEALAQASPPADQPSPPPAAAPPTPAPAAPGAPAASVGTPAAVPAAPAVPAAVPATPAAVPVGTPAVVMDGDSASTVLGKSIRSTSGEDMGRVVDVIVGVDGAVRAAVIDFGGFLGVGSRKIAVDWRALSFGPESRSGRITLALTRNQVRLSPEYKAGEPIVVLGGAPAEPVSVANTSSTAPAGAPSAPSPAGAPAVGTSGPPVPAPGGSAAPPAAPTPPQ